MVGVLHLGSTRFCTQRWFLLWNICSFDLFWQNVLWQKFCSCIGSDKHMSHVSPCMTLFRFQTSWSHVIICLVIIRELCGISREALILERQFFLELWAAQTQFHSLYALGWRDIPPVNKTTCICMVTCHWMHCRLYHKYYGFRRPADLFVCTQDLTCLHHSLWLCFFLGPRPS